MIRSVLIAATVIMAVAVEVLWYLIFGVRFAVAFNVELALIGGGIAAVHIRERRRESNN